MRARSRKPTPRCARPSKAFSPRSKTRGDEAIRDLSKKFDNWAPEDFRLTPQEIEKAIAQVAKRDLDDIKFAQAQVRNFAQKQRDTHAGHRGRDAARRRPRPPHIPVNAIGCYVPGGRYPMVASAHMSIVTARSPA